VSHTAKQELFRYFYEREDTGFNVFLKLSNQKRLWCERIVSRLGPNLKDRFRFLDIGCGEGSFTYLIGSSILERYRITPQIVAVDPSLPMLEAAQKLIDKNLDIRFLLGGIGDEDLPIELQNQRFDFVLCSHIFFWVEDWPLALDQILSVVSDTGHALIIILAPTADQEAYALRRRLLGIAHGGMLELENGQKVENLLDDRSIPFRTESLVSTIKINAVALKCLHDNLEFFLEDLPNEALSLAHIIEFLVRKQWNKLTTNQREDILKELKDCVEGRQLLIKTSEEGIWLQRS